MLKRIFAVLLSCIAAVAAVAAQDEVRKSVDKLESLRVEVQSLTPWNRTDGIPYKQVPGANLGATSFEVLDDSRIAFLCNSTNEIMVVDRTTGIAINRFDVAVAPRDFSFSNGHFFVLTENRVIQYDENGNYVNSFPIPETVLAVERLIRFDNATYLLLPSGDSLMIERDGHSIETSERRGWITGAGNYVETRINGTDSFSVEVIAGDGPRHSKTFKTDKLVAGVYVVGSTKERVVLDVQTFRSEYPVSVERTLIAVELSNKGLGPIRAKAKVPDTYYILSNKDFAVTENGEIFNMVTTPEGLYMFSLTESRPESVRAYPSDIDQARYHFNDHLIPIDDDKEVQALVPSVDAVSITRNQIINNALPYTTLSWTATSSNIQSTCATLSGYYYRTPPWVTVGTKTSVPYKWGGFTDVNAFAALAAQGKKAGNYATTGNSTCPQPPYAGVSDTYVIGVDCSGLVSRAWGLTSKYGTTGLPGISTAISYSQLQPGDIVNKEGDHTRLIKTYHSTNGSAEVIEASGADWKTTVRSYNPIQQSGYIARVYNNVASTTTGTFSVTATPITQTVTQGGTISFTAAVRSLNNFGSAVSLQGLSLPTGYASAYWTPSSSVTPPVNGTGYSTLVIGTNLNTVPGTYNVTIRGTSGSLTTQTSVQLIVNRLPAPTISSYSWTSIPRSGNSFGGYVYGQNYISGGTRIFFCQGTTCYEHASAGIVVNSSSRLTLSGVRLSRGYWNFYVRTAVGVSARSSSFYVN